MTRQLGLVLSTIMFAVVAAAVAVAPSAHAALGLRPTPDQTWMTNGNVYAQALSADKKVLYIGGSSRSCERTRWGKAVKSLR